MTRPRLKSDLQLVLELLPSLSEEDLEEVQKQIKALSQFHRRSTAHIDDDYILKGILYVVEWHGLSETIPSFFKIKNSKSFNSYGKHAESVREMFDRHMPDLTLPEKLLLGRLCAKLLWEHLETWCAPTFVSMLAHASRVPRVVEDAFPGYIANGGMPYVIRALASPHGWNGEFDDC